VNSGWKRRFDEPMPPSRALQTATKPEGVAKLYTDLIASPLVKFPPKSLVVPLLQGVYIIYGPDGRVLHVGSTRADFREYGSDLETISIKRRRLRWFT
jgi:hypothetical protein